MASAEMFAKLVEILGAAAVVMSVLTGPGVIAVGLALAAGAGYLQAGGGSEPDRRAALVGWVDAGDRARPATRSGRRSTTGSARPSATSSRRFPAARRAPPAARPACRRAQRYQVEHHRPPTLTGRTRGRGVRAAGGRAGGRRAGVVGIHGGRGRGVPVISAGAWVLAIDFGTTNTVAAVGRRRRRAAAEHQRADDHAVGGRAGEPAPGRQQWLVGEYAINAAPARMGSFEQHRRAASPTAPSSLGGRHDPGRRCRGGGAAARRRGGAQAARPRSPGPVRGDPPGRLAGRPDHGPEAGGPEGRRGRPALARAGAAARAGGRRARSARDPPTSRPRPGSPCWTWAAAPSTWPWSTGTGRSCGWWASRRARIRWVGRSSTCGSPG